MPAIEISRLQNQTEQLVSLIGDPQAFRSELHEILSFYHRYSHRPAENSVQKSFMRMYDLPSQVTRQIEVALRKPANAMPEEVLALVDVLWLDDHFEARDVAAFLLGQVPLAYSDQVLSKILAWVGTPLDRAVVSSIFTKADATIRAKDDRLWLSFLYGLISNPNPKISNFGLYGLSLVVQQLPLTQIPSLFNMIRPLFQDGNRTYTDSWQRIIHELIKINPGETVYFLKQVLSDTQGKEIERTMRSFLNLLPEENRSSLQTAIKYHQAFNQ